VGARLCHVDQAGFLWVELESGPSHPRAYLIERAPGRRRVFCQHDYVVGVAHCVQPEPAQQPVERVQVDVRQ
jgi:hypothetical protein